MDLYKNNFRSSPELKLNLAKNNVKLKIGTQYKSKGEGLNCSITKKTVEQKTVTVLTVY